MERDLSNASLPYLMLGHEILVHYLAGPGLGVENANERLLEGEVLREQSEARSAFFWLFGVSSIGIEVSEQPEPGGEFFIPWGAVLRMVGPSREELKRFAREADEQIRAERES